MGVFSHRLTSSINVIDLARIVPGERTKINKKHSHIFQLVGPIQEETKQDVRNEIVVLSRSSIPLLGTNCRTLGTNFRTPR